MDDFFFSSDTTVHIHFTMRLASERSVNLVRQRNYKTGTMHSVKRAWSSLIIAVCIAVASDGWLHLQPREIMVEILEAI